MMEASWQVHIDSKAKGPTILAYLQRLDIVAAANTCQSMPVIPAPFDVLQEPPCLFQIPYYVSTTRKLCTDIVRIVPFVIAVGFFVTYSRFAQFSIISV